MKFKVPSITCQGCVDTITTEIKTHEPEAKVEVDLEGKTVSVDETKASEESIKQMITAVGHTVE